MPTNKHASFRYRVLNVCFRRPRRWTLDELVAEVSSCLHEDFGTLNGVSKRTVQYDINLMKSSPPRGFDAPIVCEGGKYTYADRSFSIEQRPLTEKDVMAIKEALALLRQFSGLPHFKSLMESLHRLEGRTQYPDHSVIQFETNDQVAGTKWLGGLYDAILSKTVLEIGYQPFNVDEPYQLVFHPYHLREYRNRWFVFGWHDALKTIHTLALDRIIGISKSTKRYHFNGEFHPHEYFRDLIGVTKPEEGVPVEVVFRVTRLLSKYLETKPLHHSQTYRGEENGEMEFSIKVIPNYEMYSELARFGKSLGVVAPEEVRQCLLEF
ncbi:MAG: WYL domain-containing protein [Saprospiraceae bacterium]|nr:WYL domain-containing protein [Saprospiraceae bacterium]